MATVYCICDSLIFIYDRISSDCDAIFYPVKEKTNIDEIIGKKAVVIESIDNLQGTGKVRYQGMEWTARAEEENDRIEKDAEVEIIAVKGVKLIVKMKG